jgi:hypothetical protein
LLFWVALGGVGVAYVLIAILAGNMFKSRGNDFVASSVPILTTGGLLGCMGGFMLSMFLFKADGKTTLAQEETLRKHIGLGGLLSIFSGFPYAIVTALFAFIGPHFSLAHAVGEKAFPYVLLLEFMAVCVVIFILYDRFPKRLIIPVGLLGWVLTFSIACWYFWFGPGALSHPRS